MAVAARLAFVFVLIINCILWSQSRFGHVHRLAPPVLARRFTSHQQSKLDITLLSYRRFQEPEKECQPLNIPLKDQCAHVDEACPPPDTFLSIPYLHEYFCASPAARSFIFFGLLVWLIFLFSTLGISASDFFCPNLATLAHLLGLDENVAGVTFLAFGNGSPDVFSTFSAMRANSGSLAIGELLGAASFIVSVVVGSMCIIKPFKIRPAPFLRDISFFAVAVTTLFIILLDGFIHAWEALLLVALYVVYVATVVVGTWWEKKRDRKFYLDTQIRSEYADDSVLTTEFDVPYRDEPEVHDSTPDLLQAPTPHGRRRAISHPSQPSLGLQTDLPPRSHSRSRAETRSPLTHLPSFSIVRALEFRDVIASLQNRAAGSSLGVFDSPLTPFSGGHYHRIHPNSRSRSPSHLDEEFNPFDGSDMPLNDRSPDLSRRHSELATETSPLVNVTDIDVTSIPIISHTPASPDTPTISESRQASKPSQRRRILRIIGYAWHILFPTFHDFRDKSILGKIAAIFAAPAVFALTLTLPVIVIPYDAAHSHYEKSMSTTDSLIAIAEGATECALLAEEDIQEEMNHISFNKWLMAAQCTLGPLFAIGVLFKNMANQGWLLLAGSIAGLAIGVLIVVFAVDGEHPASRMARCSMGFAIAVVWIMAIADEVVNVLQTFGFIFGLSDAIVGLTIFAVGNSLADLVANMSVAVFAPIMGFSACFGGPMLNMLLGVGIAGTYVTSQTGEAYVLHFSRTLLVSSLGLLLLLIMTAIFVPFNDYYLPRKWGFFLIASYVAIMIVNVVVEVLSHH
ncbi:Sodium/calcium exchanger protein-domain-containing protein [Vararia minispora EC-137]|uniref:Sodium/calcium exchanger protein-domain-containing protein n=1 Tax=Vararia minispora EC-137 TaxID=1314806 RepID=A0ACB8QP98_9AGAM|nr:Sodium/calcium exchanger protein-domain-containing protein [Vararia minispora EC-137]